MARFPRYRISLVKETTVPYNEKSVSDPKNLVDSLFNEFFADADRESLLVVTLDAASKPIGVNVVTVGVLNESLSHPREVLKMAILQNAAAIIVVHNHPSGVTQPSTKDKTMTQRLKQACDIIGIPLLDHIIIGSSTNYFSFAAERLL